MNPIRSIPKTQIADFCPENCLLSPFGKANSYFVQFVFRTNRQEFKSGIPVYDNREKEKVKVHGFSDDGLLKREPDSEKNALPGIEKTQEFMLTRM